MKTAFFALAALFGLGFGLAAVGVPQGLLILGGVIACLTSVSLIWLCARILRRRPTRATQAAREKLHAMTRPIARRFSRNPASSGTAPAIRAPLALAQRISRFAQLPFTPLLSALMGLSLGAALARSSADLPAALLCGGLAAALHLIATGHPPRKTIAPPAPDRITDSTQTHLTRLIAALAPCRDPHLHVAARALRRAAQALAAQVDHAPTQSPQAHRALSLWLPALAEAAEHLRTQHVTAADPALTASLCADLTATLTRVATQLTALSPQTDAPPTANPQPAPLSQAQAPG